MRYKLTIAYDGTHYSGWQVQENAISIQRVVQKFLEVVLRHPCSLTGSGRTDAGVHARGQTAHFDTDAPIRLSSLRHSLNALLPLDIRILQIDEVTPLFHARYSATSKIYHYHLQLDSVLDPFARLYRHQFFFKLDLELLKKGAALFLGTHDFTSFANLRTQDELYHNAVRTLMRLDVVEQKGGLRLEFEGDGFLYKMVRNITGTLLNIARGRLPLSAIPEIFAARNRKKAGPAVPAQGLFLMEVRYNNESLGICSKDSKCTTSPCAAISNNG
ncbi:MAG: tRNA pseudouridine(38-40) synthase TruA [Chlamydiota bacterium]